MRRASLVFVIGDVEPAAFENQSCAAAHEALEPSFLAHGAFREPLVAHRLDVLEGVAAFGAFILVGGHR